MYVDEQAVFHARLDKVAKFLSHLFCIQLSTVKLSGRRTALRPEALNERGKTSSVVASKRSGGNFMKEAAVDEGFHGQVPKFTL